MNSNSNCFCVKLAYNLAQKAGRNFILTSILRCLGKIKLFLIAENTFSQILDQINNELIIVAVILKHVQPG